MAVLALVMAACGGTTADTTQAPADTEAPAGTEAPADTEAPAAMDGVMGMCPALDEPITLEYWTWGAGYPQAAELWNSENPDIQVNFSDIAVGIFGGYQKLRNAMLAGEAPDVMFIEFDSLPSFAIDGSVIDVAAYLPASTQADFLETMIDQVDVLGQGTMFEVPLGGSPMTLMVRQDLFDQYDIAVPTTWEEFAIAAEEVAATGQGVIASFDGVNNANWWAGMTAQNGSNWFQSSDTGWSVQVDDAASQEVAAYWQDLIDRGLVDTMPSFSPEWNAAFANNELWTWVTANWGAGVLKAVAPDTTGGWRVVQLPTWGPDKPVGTTWGGGGGLAVMASSEHPCEAAAFATWMSTDLESMEILHSAIGIFPTTYTLFEAPLFAEADPFFGGQSTFSVFVEAAGEQAPITWGPAMGDTYAAIVDAFGAALEDDSTTLVDALTTADADTEAAIERQGFAVVS